MNQLNLLRILFYSVLKVHDSSCNRMQDEPNRTRSVLRIFPRHHWFTDLLCGQCYSISVPRVWERLRSKQLLELHQTPYPPNTRESGLAEGRRVWIQWNGMVAGLEWNGGIRWNGMVKSGGMEWWNRVEWDG